jgi:hypothetical protein
MLELPFAGTLELLEIKYTLAMINIPPTMVVGRSWSCSRTIASMVPSSGCTKRVDAAAEPSIVANPLNQAK